MSGARSGLGSFSPMMAGFSAAVALETSAGLLLYTDQGFLPALTLILTVEVGAFGLGLWSASWSGGGGIVDQIRRRWLFALVAFALAAALSGWQGFTGDLPGSGLGQGLGLGFLGSLPLFSIGSLLGVMSAPDGSGRPFIRGVGAPGAIGAATGFLLAGTVLLPNLAPHTLYLSCLVVLSGGALLQGWVLDARPSVEVIETVQGATGELCVEGRAVGRPRRRLKVLLEEGRVRGAEDSEGEPARDWEVAVLEAMGLEGWNPQSVLYLGGGSGTLARLVSHRFPDTRIQIVERSSELVELARSQFAEWDGWEGVGLEIKEPLAVEAESVVQYSLILLDSGALPALGSAPFLGEANWRFLADALAPGGRVIMGGLRARRDRSSYFNWDVIRGGSRWFEGFSLYQGGSVPPGAGLLEEGRSGPEILLVFSASGAPPLPPYLSGFERQPLEQG